MSLGRGTGLIEEDAELVGVENLERPLSSMVGLGARPVSVRYDHLLDKILDQGSTNSCVGCAISTAVYLRGQLSTPCHRPSAKLIYDLARLAYGDTALVDEGCRPADAIRMSSDKGLVAEEEWPLFTDDDSFLILRPTEETSWIDTPPPFDVFHEAYDARVTGYFRADFGDIVGLLESALAIGQIPVRGHRTRKDYGDVRGDEVYDVPSNADPSGLLGHMEAVVGYDDASFYIASSWGREHGNNGIVRVAKRHMADPRWCHSRIVVTTVPARLAA